MIKKISVKHAMLLFVLLVLSISVKAQFWAQVGNDIDGEEAYDQSGDDKSVCLNSDGTIVAIGANLNDGNGSESGHVRIFQNIGGTWTQVGSDIDGEAAYDESGYSISLNSDGTIVAIGAKYNDGSATDAGQVRIYQNLSDTWTQIGQDIDGEAGWDYSGYSVSLSSDGTVVAIGATENDGNGTRSGHVRVYENQFGTWMQIGEDIDGEAADDYSGRSLSLSSDGSVVAIGSPFNDGSGTSAGHVRIYQNINGIWTQVGEDIDGDGEQVFDNSGYSISLNADGSIVAIGAIGYGNNTGKVCIYQNQNDNWVQIGQGIPGESIDDESGHSVSLSSDGSIVAIGAWLNDGNGNQSGQVRVFQNQDQSWIQLGEDIDGESAGDRSGTAISLSSNGSVLAIGAYGNSDNGTNSGHVRIFELKQPPIILEQPEDRTNICIGDNVLYTITGEYIDIHQWQLDDGSGFENISESTVYSGVSTGTLEISGVSLEMNNNLYRCLLSNDDGETISDTSILTIDNEIPTFTCISNTIVNADQTGFYTVSGTEFDPTETADNCDIESIENDFNNTNTLADLEIPEGLTTITWTISDIAGNENTCSFDITVNAYVDIEILNQKGISIFPNPTNGIINIDLSNNNIRKITISDINGKQIIEKTDIVQNESIDLTSYKKGIYIIYFQTDNEFIEVKIIKR